jgi:hypothetical protein
MRLTFRSGVSIGPTLDDDDRARGRRAMTLSTRLPRVEIVVEPDSLERTAHGTISGRVWLRDGNPDAQADFPEVGWSDAPVALLAAWTAELHRFARAVPATGALATCRFLDGPYAFTVRAEQPEVWRVACSEERTVGSSNPGPNWLTDRASFLRSLDQAARGVLAFCDARGWWSADTEALRRRLEGAGLA